MTLTGELLIGAARVPATAGTMKALDPSTGELLEPEFSLGGPAEVDRALRLADEAFDGYSHTGLAERAAFLDLIADKLEAVKDELAARTSLETGLPATQLEGETLRAAAHFRKFATVVRQGRFLQATIDPAQPDRQPAPRMDHRMQKVALGPVVIFGASNFPISYSVAGGDTASALAAGCPVVLKAHNAHPGASEIQGRAIQQAVAEAGLHEGVFSLVRGAGNDIGEALVSHPLVRAVTFTGSEGGGMALFRRAQQRPDPIPVFTEMTSVNPTFVLPAALAARGAQIGADVAQRAQYNVGQACLKPAVLLAIDGPGFTQLRDAATAEVEKTAARTMLTPGIHDSYTRRVRRMEEDGATRIGAGAAPVRAGDGQSVLYEVTGEQLLAEPALREEVFGPTVLLVRLTDPEQLQEVARSFRGQLSATVHAESADRDGAVQLLPILERRTGRIVINAFSMPQEVSYASVHTGPFPATSDSRFTSVGMSAIERFLRPITYQGFPDELLPEPLREANTLHLWRLVDGELTRN
ncbi:aldehyde dehydrogenase (NADP(+)) [Streptomyces olivochromogenes]|uniref:Fatty aldehyde dehydrogenase n=1 Tax=Streptomyces olivochromogenes TaxID=1963 RepID=A0A250VQR0_STROL|nr:aldehyde dehydrogenase (NADP(+)) [Streptomyces olivochromogenes]KUN39418.1 2,5-dioxovalerate dehydrogenase [Streptomyces olivochromogenes]GAX56414.1 fatty aldehyde dehydrogenase [Streptomyces olivochromogenes]